MVGNSGELTTVAEVDVKSAWSSKINWTQAVAIVASGLVFLTGGKVNIPVEVQVQIVTCITVAQGVATWIMKTWFTRSITPASAASPDVPTKEVVK